VQISKINDTTVYSKWMLTFVCIKKYHALNIIMINEITSFIEELKVMLVSPLQVIDGKDSTSHKLYFY